MYRMDIHITVKTLLKNGVSRRQISQQLGIHRKVIKRIEQEQDDGANQRGYHRAGKLDAHREYIKSLLESEWTTELIHNDVTPKIRTVNFS